MGVEDKPRVGPLFPDQHSTHSGAGYSEICCANILRCSGADWCMKRCAESKISALKWREAVKRGFQKQAEFKAEQCTRSLSCTFLCVFT